MPVSDKVTKITDVEKGKRLSYLWDYYKYPALAVIVIAIMCVSLTYHIFFKPRPDSYVFLAVTDKPVTTELTDNLKQNIIDNMYDINEDSTIKLKFDPIVASQNIKVEESEQQTAMATKFAALLSTGTYIIEIVDNEAFTFLEEEGLVADYSVLEKFGYTNSQQLTGSVKIPIENTKLGSTKGLEIVKNQLFLTLRPPSRSSDNSGKGAETYKGQAQFFISLLN